MTEALIRLVKRTSGSNPIALTKSLDSICAALTAQSVEYPKAIVAFAGEVANELRTNAEKALARKRVWSIGATEVAPSGLRSSVNAPMAKLSKCCRVSLAVKRTSALCRAARLHAPLN